MRLKTKRQLIANESIGELLSSAGEAIYQLFGLCFALPEIIEETGQTLLFTMLLSRLE